MVIEQYLKRIKYSGDLSPNLDVLRALHKNHLYNVPFENLDIHYQRNIELDTEKFYKKIVLNNRGGFCYELNGLFYQMLKKLGFQAIMVSAMVFNVDSGFSPEFDHCAIIVSFEKLNYLVDVGFGEFIFEPLKLELNKVQKNEEDAYFIDQNRTYYQVNKVVEGKNQPVYKFEIKPRDLSEFSERCHFHQYDPMSYFKKNRLISIPTENGRTTITGSILKITKNNNVIEKEIKSEAEFNKHLEILFKTTIG